MQLEESSIKSNAQLSEPIVSVLMPVYNCERYLRQTLDSLTAQTMTDFEVILVNDGSTDSSGKIVEEFSAKDSRFRVLNQTNQGIVAALNNGLALVKGKYIARLDSDDLAHPDRLKLQVEYLDQHLGCVCVGSLYRAIDENGTVIWTQKVFSRLNQTNLDIFPPRVTVLPHPSIMLRTADLKQINGYRFQFPHAEDYDLFLRLSGIGTLAIIPQHLLDYRVHQSSLSSQNLEKQLDSALMALLSATITQKGGKDPAVVGANSLENYYQELSDKLTKILFTRYRTLRIAGAWMNRGDLSNAKSALNSLFNTMLKDFFELSFDKRYWMLIAAAVKARVKIMVGRI